MSVTLILTSSLCCSLSLQGLSKPYFEPPGPAAVFLPPLPLLLLLSTKQRWWLLLGPCALPLAHAENKTYFHFSSLWLVTHHFIREKGMRRDRGEGVGYVGLRTQGFRDMESSVGKRA